MKEIVVGGSPGGRNDRCVESYKLVIPSSHSKAYIFTLRYLYHNSYYYEDNDQGIMVLEEYHTIEYTQFVLNHYNPR